MRLRRNLELFDWKIMKLEQASDAVLVELCRQGQTKAFDEIDDRYRERLRSFLSRRLHFSVADAEDLAQRSLIKAYESLKQLAAEQSFAPWLFRIAFRLGLDERRRVVPLSLNETVSAGEPGATRGDLLCDAREQEPVAQAVAREERENIWRLARATLSQGDFSLLWLYYAEQRSDREIATILKKKPGAVRVALSRARHKLMSVLPNRYDSEPE
ncbi:MAG: RNA polymerase sigma factor [Planctomycetia bacterium]|nr:RNA polymerase sigma factor [Planctomycetia bacterium]